MSAITTDITPQGPTFANTLWLTGFLPRLVFISFLTAIIAWEVFALPILAAIFVFDLPIFIWSFSRYNAAAMLYLRSTLRFWTVLGGYSLFFASALISLFAWWLVLYNFERPISAPQLSSKKIMAPSFDGERYKIYFSKDATELHFKGVIAEGAVIDFERFVLQEEGIKTLVLESTGGNVYEARKFAKDIRKYGLNTRVDTECNSSCLLLFVAGENRTLGNGAKLGVHRYGLDIDQLHPNARLISEIRIDQEYYLSRGIELDFLDKYFDLDRASIWYPRRQELVTAGIIDQ